jgi:flagellar basal-body rod modification protein FlgD
MGLEFMQVSTTNAISAGLFSTDTSTADRVPTETLGQDDFLKLLIAQLSAQDPLNPMKDTEFIAQLAQFSTLQATMAMESDIAQMSKQQQFLQANALIGREVILQDDQGTVISGTVSAVLVDSGTPKIVVNGQAYDLSSLLYASAPPVATTQP